MKKASCFVPGHISGFFRIHDESENPLKIGSSNCGPCIDAGVETTVEVEPSDSLEVDVYINGDEDDAGTTRAAVENVLESVGVTPRIRIEHSVQAPIGSGYGMSGAGALGAVFALSKSLGLGLDGDRMLAEAHKAEVECRSGLGDVGPQVRGGLVIGLRPGAPPFGKWERISIGDEWMVVCGTSGSLSTSGFLDGSGNRKRSKELGKIAMRDLLAERSLENFMRVSRKFAVGLQVYDDGFLEVLNEISSGCPLGASAVMLGKAVFAPVPVSDLDSIEDLFLDYFDREMVMRASLDTVGARILEGNRISK